MKLPLYIKIIIGLFLGIVWSVASTELGWNDFTIRWIDPFGEIFIRLLKLIAAPLVLFSITSGVASFGDIGKLGRLGGKTLLLYLATTVLAVFTGLFVSGIFKPGTYVSEDQLLRNRLEYEQWAKNNNIVIADGKDLSAEMSTDPAGEVEAADAIPMDEKLKQALESTSKGPLNYLVEMVPENIVFSISDNKFMLQVIFFSIFMGITMLVVPAEMAAPVLNFIQSANHLFMKMVDLIMKAAPYFVFALMAGIVAKMASSLQEVLEIFKSLGMYSLTVVAGLVIILFLVYPLIIYLGAKVRYAEFFRNMSPAQFLAFSTSSSAATLPVTIECVQNNLGVSEKTAGFVLPIGATVNMDGTCIYQTIAVVFLAQLHMIDLTFGQQMSIVMLATLASIGSAAVPSGGIVMLMVVLLSVGLNPAWIAIILPVDRILDMCRTVVNISGDAVVATMVAASEGELKKKGDT